jgi:cytoskeletal protein RodZ
MAPLLGTSATLSGSLRGTQVSSVTDLMDELTRQRRVTTRLLGGLVLLVAFALMFGVYWTLVLRPAQTSEQAAASALATKQAATVAAAELASARNTSEPATPAALEEPRAEVNDKPSSSSVRHGGKVARVAPVAASVVATAAASSPAAPAPAPPPPAAAAEVGYLNLDTTPWSTVSVGGRVLGQTPLVGASLPAGTHTLVLSNPEQGVRTTYQVTISAGKTTARRIGLD